MSLTGHRVGMRTPGQQRGDTAEALIANRLSARGWVVLGRKVHVGRAEIDILAVDPGPPRNLVAVEVRWRTRRDFGLAEETVDWRKIQRLRRAAWALREGEVLDDGTSVPRLPARIDVIAVEPGAGNGPVRVRHHRAVG